MVFAPPPCHRLPCQISTLPFGISAAIESYGAPKSGEWSAGCVPGMMRVAPLASVKSVSAHIELQTVGTCGFASGMSWSSAWIGCAVSPGRILIEDSDEMRQPGIEHALDDRQHARVHRHPLPDLAEREQVVDAQRVLAFERVVGRLDLEERLEVGERLRERVDQLGLDRVLDDRVAVALDVGHVGCRRPPR